MMNEIFFANKKYLLLFRQAKGILHKVQQNIENLELYHAQFYQNLLTSNIGHESTKPNNFSFRKFEKKNHLTIGEPSLPRFKIFPEKKHFKSLDFNFFKF